MEEERNPRIKERDGGVKRSMENERQKVTGCKMMLFTLVSCGDVLSMFMQAS